MFEDSRRFSRSNNDDSGSGLTLAPMIDVVFLLLIFFMVSTTFVIRPGLKLQLPTSESQSEVPADRWVVSISPEGKYYLNQSEITLQSLRQTLRSDPRPVTIRADRSIPHGMVVTALDTVQLAGIENVNISTMRPNRE